MNVLLSRIRRNVSTSSWMRILSLKYRYLMLMNLDRYDNFEVKGDTNVELMLDIHCSTGNVILELYAQFVDVEEGGLSLKTVPVNLFQEQEVKSPTTQLCGDFTMLLQSSYRGMFESLIGRHSLVLTLDFNFGVQSGLVGNLNAETSTRHFVSAFHITFRTSYARNTYVAYTNEGAYNSVHEIANMVDNEKEVENEEEAENKEKVETNDN
ncbi:hypothetical protein J1N35_040446 [Gossypium stocksii]|uniref:Uncharacterized protein n=1 Tax=Gossypium stocksii TaxID=47602 RepID=A0A9D3UE49_9ROSI|nr:hypothetical protein J1N35_040446 [Gossypium stocksii]